MIGSPVLEVKRTLDGREHTFHCTLVHHEAGWMAVRYVLPQSTAVGPLVLPAGAETVAHYWSERPYTAYHWRTHDHRTLGVYLNAADEVEITPGLVRWRDLALDVLVTPDGRVEMLDEDEARRAPPSAQPMIVRARASLEGDAAAIAAEVQRLTEQVGGHRGTAHRR